eukprot:PhF_6_TR10114/c0_g1_i1/m.15728
MIPYEAFMVPALQRPVTPTDATHPKTFHRQSSANKVKPHQSLIPDRPPQRPPSSRPRTNNIPLRVMFLEPQCIDNEPVPIKHNTDFVFTNQRLLQKRRPVPKPHDTADASPPRHVLTEEKIKKIVERLAVPPTKMTMDDFYGVEPAPIVSPPEEKIIVERLYKGGKPPSKHHIPYAQKFALELEKEKEDKEASRLTLDRQDALTVRLYDNRPRKEIDDYDAVILTNRNRAKNVKPFPRLVNRLYQRNFYEKRLQSLKAKLEVEFFTDGYVLDYK